VANPTTGAVRVTAILTQESPPVYVTALQGPWLLSHSTPSWRIEDPQKGFQRIVKKDRAMEIARTVLDHGRTFPNALTLATNAPSFPFADNILTLPANSKLLVVDGQHRLWAQKFSDVAGTYPCIIHLDRTEADMAFLFLEINDNQRRVPSSLRWDLVRLVRSGDQATAMTADVVYELAIRKESPFNNGGIDLTGEKKEVVIKQGSLAPEIKTLINRDLKEHRGDTEEYLGLLINFFVAIRSMNPDGWGDPESPFYRARVMRAMIRILSDMLGKASKISDLTSTVIRKRLEKIDPETLSPEHLRKIQGSAGVLDLYREMQAQVFGK
jgi:DGQHR domain-containing protein